MKKLIFAAVCALMLCACTPQDTQTDKLSIVCASFPPYDFARNIAADRAQVRLLVPPGSDSHSYDPTPSDVIAVENADIFIYGGGESDEWARDILDAADVKPKSIIQMCGEVELLEEERVEGMQVHHEEEEGEEETDEHVWTSPKNAQAVCAAIERELSRLDADAADIYSRNLSEYNARLEELDAEFRSAVQSGGKTLIFGDRFPFLYLTREYGLDYYAAFPGCAELTEPAAKTVAFLIDKVKEEKIPVVFYTEFSNHKICDTIAYETGAEPRLMHSCHNLTKSEFESGVGYIELMQGNAEAIREALSGVAAGS